MGKARKTAILKAFAREWGVWRQTECTDQMRSDFPHLMHCKHIWANQRYEVQAFVCETSIGGVWQLGIIRHGDIEAIAWGEIQRIVHDLFGSEVVAVEVYPAIEHEWQTTTGLRVIWILPSTWPLPFGLQLASAWGKPQ